jgi:hypothetical protein
LHEQITYDTPVIKGLIDIPNISITHNGYSDPLKLKEKTDRNMEILRAMEPSANQYFELARTQMSAGLPIDAIENLVLSKHNGGDTPFIKFYLAECLAEAAQNGSIETLLETSIDYIPDARFRLGEAQAIKGQYKQAIKNLSTYVLKGDVMADYGSNYSVFKPKAIDMILKCAENL